MRLMFVLMLALAAGTAAQEVKQEDKKTPPALTEDDLLLMRGVIALGELANKDCGALTSFQRYNQQQRDVSARFAQKYPEFTLNWSTASLVPKE